MQFNTGNPNLVGYARFYVNDPASAPTQQYSTQEVKDAVNLAYFDLLAEVKSWNPGAFLKTDTASTVKDQVYYSFPSDFDRMLRLEVEYNGKAIETDSEASPQKLDQVGFNVLQDHTTAGTSGLYLWTPRHTDFAIYPAVSTAGTGSMRYTYEFEPTALSADSDEPVVIPEEHHKLISLRAAKDLKIARDLDYNQLERENLVGTNRLQRHFVRRHMEGQSQFRNATGDIVHKRYSDTGYID